MVRVTRRTALQLSSLALSGGLAGCLSAPTKATTPSATPPQDRPDGFWRWVNIEDLEPPPDESQVGFDLTVTQPWVSEERTARIEATLTNEADVTRQFRPVLLPDDMVAAPKGIRVFEDTAHPDQAHEPTCTGGDGKADEPVGHSSDGPATEILEPGGTHKTIGYVVDDEEVEGCYPSGIYDFPTQQTVTPVDGGAETSYRVSFSLGVQGKNE